MSDDSTEKLLIKTSDLREHYDVKEEVGRGKFGVVHKVVKKSSREVHAAKFITISHGTRKDVMHEIEIMQLLHHENLVHLVDVFDMDKRIVLIMEFISGGELFERIVEEDNLTEAEASVYMKQILEGLQYMHNKNIVHLDLKPENVVCIEPNSTHIKLIDFGLARQLEHGKEMKITCGTPEFVAPEVLNFDPVTLASDMWSIGVIAYILLSGLSPFLGDTDPETFANVTSCEWDFDDESFDEVSDSSKDFIEGLIIDDPGDRRTVAECLEHEWIQNHDARGSKKLRVDNLRKFLAKKRWQKSVNAVRAIRRLSSFGASLLGKKSLLSRGKSICEDTVPSSITEETFQEGADDGHDSIRRARILSNRQKSVIDVDKLIDGGTGDAVDQDFVRSTGSLSDFKKNFDNPSRSSKQSKVVYEDSCLEEDGNAHELEGASNVITSVASGEFFHSNVVDDEKLEQKVQIGAKQGICDEDNKLPGVFSESLKSNFRVADKSETTNSASLEKRKLNSTVIGDDRSLINGILESLRKSSYVDEDICNNSVGSEGIKATTEIHLQSATKQENNFSKSYTNSINEKIGYLQSNVDNKIFQESRHSKFIEKLNEGIKESCFESISAEGKEDISSEPKRVNGGVELSGGSTKQSDCIQHFLGHNKQNIEHNRESERAYSSVKPDGEISIPDSLRLPLSQDENKLIKHSEKTSSLLTSSSKVSQESKSDSLGSLEPTRDKSACLQLSDDSKHSQKRIQDQPSLKQIKADFNGLQSIKDDCYTHITTREETDEYIEPNKTGSGDFETRTPKASLYDVTTKSGLRSYLQCMIKEGRLPGSALKLDMPRQTRSYSSSAASKRASFRDILTVSVASEDDSDCEDEEPIKVQVSKKLKFEDYYEVQEEIGRGRFGVVNKVIEKSTGKFYAAKHIKVRAATRELVRQEIEVLCSVRHRRIVKLHAAFEESRKFILVLELVGGGELFEKLSEEELISEGEAVFFIKQILHGVKSMHKNGILHLDLKPENIMLVDSSSAEIKIIDFGLAKKFNPNEDIKVLSGTPAFAAPEVINFEKITKATDIWSIGVIAYVLLSGVSPFLGDDVHETCSNVNRCEWDFDHHAFEKVSSEAKDFITKVIIKNPKHRMDVEQCFNHPWIKNSSSRRRGQIETRPLFRFTRSFTQTFIDGDDELLRPPLERSEKIEQGRTHSNLQDITEIKEEIVEKDEMMGTNDNHPSTTKNGFKGKSVHEEKEMFVLEERLKTMERDCDEMRHQLVRQTDLQNEVELMKLETEKSLQAHKQLQEAILAYEKDNNKLTDKTKAQKREIDRLESKYEDLKQELDEKTNDFESLSRRYKRMLEKLEKAEDMEDVIAGLERDKTRKMDKINELEERIIELTENKRRDRDEDKARKKLEKDYKALQDINESCHQELEEMDERVSTLESENTRLRKELKQQRDENSNEVSETIRVRIEELEFLNTELERKLVSETKNKKLIENERDSIEEEFEEERRNLESRIEKVVTQNKQLEVEKREMSCLLEASKKSYFKLDEELIQIKKARKKEVLVDEEVKRRDDIIFDLKKEKEALKTEHDRLNYKMLALLEERQKLEDEAQSKDISNLNRRLSGSNKEVERVKSDLKMTQEYLRIATDTNSELQLEIQKLKTDHETELNIQLIEQEARLTHVTEEEIDRVKEEMMELNHNERKELEDRITVQDFAIRKLQALLELREQEESEETSDLTGISVNGDARSSDSSYAKRIPDSVNVTISAGRNPRISHVEEESCEEEIDSLSERELRRISYKIADGNWTSIGQALNLQGEDYEDIMGSSFGDQEKVYRLLILWKSGISQPRCVQISRLAAAVERMKRRDIVKFIKDLNTKDATGLSIRKRIRNFIK